MRDTIGETFSKCTLSESSCFTSPEKRSRPPLRPMLILYSLLTSLLSDLCMIGFLYSSPKSQSDKLLLPPPPPQTGLSKRTTATIYTIVIRSFEMDSNFQ